MNIKKLRIFQITEVIRSLINDYNNLLDKEEISTLNSIINNLDSFNYENIVVSLSKIIKKIWNIELSSQKYCIISWNKYSKEKVKGIITSATLSLKTDIISFCEANIGIEYRITYDSILGACPKDAATLVENLDRKNDFTIAVIGDKIINSYNGATKLITPKQLVNNNDNDYPSKHNELILDTRLIEEIGPIILQKDGTLKK